MRRRLVVLSFLLAIALPTLAQEAPLAFVEADGEATVFAPPTQAEFLVEFVAPKETESNVAALARVDEAVKAFRAGLNEADLHPVDFEVSAPSVRNAAIGSASSVARLRFPLGGFANPDTGPAQFADLCDKLAALAMRVHGELTGPLYDVEDRETLLRSAVTEASKVAYPVGDAVALALASRIEYVETVKVTEIIWNKPFEGKNIEPTLKQISCTAKVHVTYAVRPAQ